MATEGYPEVVQFSGGEPTIHPEILPLLRAAKRRNMRHVMINTNGKCIATDDGFLAELAEIQLAIYPVRRISQRDLSRHPRRAGHFDEKLSALDRLADTGCKVVLVPAIERGVNEQEVGDIVRFGMQHRPNLASSFSPHFTQAAM